MAQSLFVEKDSPVDFLYLDRQRIASLVGQMSDRGMLIGLKSVVQKSLSKEGKASGTVVVATAEGRVSGTSSESSEETYDPFWTHAYSFLQDLEANFAVPLETARMGSLVKFDGLVQFLDLKIMRNLWEPSARAFLSQAPVAQAESTVSRKKRREQRLHPTDQRKPQMPEGMKFGLEVLKEVPHLLHMTFLANGGYRFWAAAQPDYLTISSDALVMKFGAVVDGLWTVVGIVDGGVGDPPKPWSISPILDGIVTGMSGLREAIGRPKNHWGLTLIAVYAPLRGAVESEAQTANPAPVPADQAP
jgi:hypothetical protein